MFFVLLYRKRKAATKLREVVVDKMVDILNGGGPWPRTDAPQGYGEISDPEHWPQTGLLAFLGDRVGQSGVEESSRRDILDYVYISKLPNVNSPDYMAEWSSASSWPRLRKMAESIAAFTRNAKRKNTPELKTSIDEWQSDLDYLKLEYYVGRYDFSWPRT